MARPKNTKNCGRFSGGPGSRNTGTIESYNQQYKQELDGYKAFAAARRSRRKHTQENVLMLYERAKEYFQLCEDQRRPATIAGLQLALNIDRETWRRANAGELDYLLEEYVTLNNVTDDKITLIDGLPYHLTTDKETGEIKQVLLVPYSALLEKTSMMIQDQLERNCYTNKGNPAGSIFSLKAQFQWREEEQPQHIVQNLVVADPEQVKKAAKMLTGLDT